MLIYHVKIENFRGIKSSDFILGEPVNCLIGAGDSTKSTILDAIEYVLSPNWFIPFDDSDFSNCDISHEIKIDVTLGPVPEDLISETKYGLHLRGWKPDTKQINDEPEDKDIKVLTIRLKVDQSLTPEWFVFNERIPDGVRIPFRDRQRIGVSRIGIDIDNELAWVRGASLLRLKQDKNDAEKIILECNRQLRTNINLNHMKDIQESVESAKKGAISLGLNLGQLKADIDPKSLRANSATLSLHNDKVPVRRMGLGSKRIIAIGSQLQCIKDGAVLLIDEVEQALEPYRIKYLIRKLIEQAQTANGQIIMTTHSPAVLEELGAKPLFIVRNEFFITTVTKVNPEAQGTVRSIPDAFLSPRVIVCEGATEVGILRSFENNILSPTNISYALKKVNIVDGKGTDATKRAKHLKDHGYDVCLFIDSDKVSEWLVAEDELLRAGIKVIRWDDFICTENRIIHDVPDKNSLKEIVEVAMTATGKTKESLISSINSKLSQNKLTDINHIGTFTDDTSLRKAIYDASVIDDREWFKTVSRGELLGNYVFQKVYTQMQTTDFYKKLEELKGWVIG